VKQKKLIKIKYLFLANLLIFGFFALAYPSKSKAVENVDVDSENNFTTFVEINFEPPTENISVPTENISDPTSTENNFETSTENISFPTENNFISTSIENIFIPTSTENNFVPTENIFESTSTENNFISTSTESTSSEPNLISTSTENNFATSTENNFETSTENISGPTSTENILAISVENNFTTSTENNFESSTENISDPLENNPSDLNSLSFLELVPIIKEQFIDNGKKVIISSPDEYDETSPIINLPVRIEILEIFKNGQEDKIKIQWKNNNNQEMQFEAYDENENGYIDHVEWIVPHLSTQTFEIIYISKALRLDSNKNVIEDIYDLVKSQDQTFASLISCQ
jgi:hypothetical protein